MYYVYVIESIVDQRLYKGHAQDVAKRLKEYNSGKVKSTKGYVSWVLKYVETFETRKEAVKREKYFKTGVGREFLNSKIMAA